MIMGGRSLSIAEVLATRVDKSSPRHCWTWTGIVAWNGYGKIKRGRKNRLAHRFVYEQVVGEIAPGMDLDHLCKNRACVNPAHLEPVTRRENNARSTSPSALNARKTHCVNGHAFTPENTTRIRTGRRCKACHAAYVRKWNARRRAVRQHHEEQT